MFAAIELYRESFRYFPLENIVTLPAITLLVSSLFVGQSFNVEGMAAWVK